MKWETEIVNSAHGPIPVVNGKRMASERDPWREAETWVKRQEIYHTDLLIFGYGAGFHIQALIRRFPQLRRLTVLELNPNLACDLLSPEVIVWRSTTKALEELDQRYPLGFQVLIHSPSWSLAANEYETALLQLTERRSEDLKRISCRLGLSFSSPDPSRRDLLDRELVQFLQGEIENSSTHLLRCLGDILR